MPSGEGPICFSNKSICPTPNSTQHGGMQGTKSLCPLSSLPCLAIMIMIISYCFALGVFSPGLSLSLPSSLGFLTIACLSYCLLVSPVFCRPRSWE